MSLDTDYKKLAEESDYLQGSLCFSDLVMRLDELRRGIGEKQKIIADLSRSRRELYARNEVFSLGLSNCFFDYIALEKGRENYPAILNHVTSLFERAEKEIRIGKIGDAIDDLIAFADEFSDFCLAQSET